MASFIISQNDVLKVKKGGMTDDIQISCACFVHIRMMIPPKITSYNNFFRIVMPYLKNHLGTLSL
jgi:hypothetical protein